MCGALLAAAVLAALAAAAGDAPPAHAAPPAPPAGRVRRQTSVEVVSESHPLGATPPPDAASFDLPPGVELGGLGALAEGGEGAWRALWHGALQQLQREPELNQTEEHVVAQLGAAAFLHCPVRHLGEQGVSWVRRRDWHIISSGLFMYTNDERFQVLHSEDSDEWTLQIKFVQRRDAGDYECQVSRGGGTLSRLVHLAVAEPEAFILGAGEHHVDQGSDISLVCIIDKSPVPPQYVFWYHNDRMINYDAASGVTVRTEPGAKTQSTLRIRRARPAHSGNYTCRAANAEPAHILVYVSAGSDKMAATLSRGTSGAPRGPLPPLAPRAALAALLVPLLLAAAVL